MNARIRTLIAQHEQKGDFTHVAPTEEMLASAQRLLDVTIPQQFVDYLAEYSHGGVGGIEGLPHNLLAVENCDEWLYCLDCDTGEVVSWSQVDGVLPGYPSFDDFLLQDLEDAIENL